MAKEEKTGIQAEPVGLLELRRCIGKSSKTKVMRVYRTEDQRGENCTEKRLQRSAGGPPQGYSTVLICKCEEQPEARKELPKSGGQYSYRIRSSDSSQQPDFKNS